jgi:hypothetical protein
MAQTAPTIVDRASTNTYTDTLTMRRLKSARSIQPISGATAPVHEKKLPQARFFDPP